MKTSERHQAEQKMHRGSAWHPSSHQRPEESTRMRPELKKFTCGLLTRQPQPPAGYDEITFPHILTPRVYTPRVYSSSDERMRYIVERARALNLCDVFEEREKLNSVGHAKQCGRYVEGKRGIPQTSEESQDSGAPSIRAEDAPGNCMAPLELSEIVQLQPITPTTSDESDEMMSVTEHDCVTSLTSDDFEKQLDRINGHIDGVRAAARKNYFYASPRKSVGRHSPSKISGGQSPGGHSLPAMQQMIRDVAADTTLQNDALLWIHQ